MVNVLLVEPNTALAKVYKDALAHAGFNVAHATGAQSAIDTIDKNTPDAVVLEIQLPAHNGIEFLQELRSYAEWQSLPVLVNTSLPPTVLAPVIKALSRDFRVKVISHKSKTSLQDLVNLVRENIIKK